MVSINRNFGVKVANTQQPAQEAVTKNDKNGTTLKKPAYPQPQNAHFKDWDFFWQCVKTGDPVVVQDGDTVEKDGIKYRYTKDENGGSLNPVDE